MYSHSINIFFNTQPLFIFLATNLQGTTLLIILLVALLLLSFTIAGAELAIFSLSGKDVNMLKTKQHPAARRIVNFLEEPKEVFASLLIANLFVNISITVLTNFLINEFISFGHLNFTIEIISKVLVIAFMLIFFGEILPKVWATQNNLRFAYGAAVVVETIHLIFSRLSRWVVSLADNIGKGMGANRSEALNMQEIDDAIDVKTDAEAY